MGPLRWCPDSIGQLPIFKMHWWFQDASVTLHVTPDSETMVPKPYTTQTVRTVIYSKTTNTPRAYSCNMLWNDIHWQNIRPRWTFIWKGSIGNLFETLSSAWCFKGSQQNSCKWTWKSWVENLHASPAQQMFQTTMWAEMLHLSAAKPSDLEDGADTYKGNRKYNKHLEIVTVVCYLRTKLIQCT